MASVVLPLSGNKIEAGEPEIKWNRLERELNDLKVAAFNHWTPCPSPSLAAHVQGGGTDQEQAGTVAPAPRRVTQQPCPKHGACPSSLESVVLYFCFLRSHP